MRALLMKELRMVVHPTSYIFVALGSLVLIPNWPYAIVLLYGILTALFNAQNAREMRDLAYSFSLPISRADMVRARLIMAFTIELTLIAIMTICICMRSTLGIDALAETQPIVGIAANVSFLGFSFATFGLFNVVFFPLYYKDPTKIGIPFLLACIPVTVFAVAFEAIPFIPLPLCEAIGSAGLGDIGVQLIVLGVGIMAFIALGMIASKLSARSFSRYDG